MKSENTHIHIHTHTANRLKMGTFNKGNFIDIKLIIVLVSSVSGAKARYSPFANNNSKTCWKLGDIPLPTSTSIPSRIYLFQFHKNIMALLPNKKTHFVSSFISFHQNKYKAYATKNRSYNLKIQHFTQHLH